MSMKLVAPTNDRTRLIWLETASAQAVVDVSEGRQWLNGPLRNNLNRLLSDYQTSASARTDLFAARRKAVSDRLAALETLGLLTRQAFGAVVKLARRGAIASVDLDLYKIASDRRFPNPRKYVEKLEVARVLLEGNTKATAAGLPPIPDPSPEMLQAAYDEAVALTQALVTAKEAVKQNAQLRADQEALLQRYWRSAARQLRDALADLPPALQREQMRRYGFTFRGTVATGETSDGTGSTDGETSGSEDTGGETTSSETSDGTTTGSGETTGSGDAGSEDAGGQTTGSEDTGAAGGEGSGGTTGEAQTSQIVG